MKKIEEISFRIVQDDMEDYLTTVGFVERQWGIWVDALDRQEIHLKGNGIYCYSTDRGSVYGDPFLEMHLNFIPEITILDYLLRKIHFIK
jgi:hypothetical protein